MIRQDLKIGNYVDRNGIMIVESIGFEKIAFYDTVNKCKTSYFEIDCWLKPFEITNEWLSKLGFEETYNSQFRLKFDHPCNFIGFDFSKTEDKSMEGFRFYGQYIKIKYIHELQNLFYALTGNELVLSGI